MKIERNFTSGTGNGVSKEHYKEFIDALNKEIVFLQSFVKHYKKTGAEKMFGSQWYALNNWHGEYKIESYADDKFPFEMVNRVGFNGWGDIELGIVIPMKFKAPTFNSGETDKMKVIFKTHCNVRGLKGFIEKYKLQPHILKEVLLCAKEFYIDKLDQIKKDKNGWITQELNKLEKIFVEKQEITKSLEENMEEIKTINDFLITL